MNSKSLHCRKFDHFIRTRLSNCFRGTKAEQRNTDFSDEVVRTQSHFLSIQRPICKFNEADTDIQ